MKRATVGGGHRAPPRPNRQRKTLRLMQALLVVLAAGMLLYAGYSLGVTSGFEAATARGQLDAPTKPTVVQAMVLAVLGLAAFAGALLLQAQGGVRLPTPARLDELAAGRGDAGEASSEPSPAARH